VTVDEDPRRNAQRHETINWQPAGTQATRRSPSSLARPPGLLPQAFVWSGCCFRWLLR
jgi:hypothetical protein